MVQSSVLSFPTGRQGHDRKEDWTKFCQDICGQNLVQSCLLSFHTDNQGNHGTKDRTKFCQDSRSQNLVQFSVSFPTGGQEHDSKEDWTKFCQDIRGQNLVQSSLLSLLTGNQAERIEPNFARTLAGKTWSNPLCCHFLPVSFCVLYLSSFLTIDQPLNKRGRSIMNNSGLNSRALDNIPMSDLGPSL